MQKKHLFCCGFEQSCKVYEFPTYKAWKRLYFLDECALCGSCVASLQECDSFGNIKILVRRSGKKAIIFRDKMLKLKKGNFTSKKGTLQKELTFYNNDGVIYNFNNRRVGFNEDFIKQVI